MWVGILQPAGGLAGTSRRRKGQFILPLREQRQLRLRVVLRLLDMDGTLGR